MTQNTRSILPVMSTVFEKALEKQAPFLMSRVNVNLIKDMRDPWRASVSHLPFLAWGRGVDLWRDNWPEWKKRRITSEIYQMKGLKGTLQGINKYLSYVDAQVYDAIIPPVGTFATGYSKEALQAWRAQFPELRLYPFSIPGQRPVFAPGSYAGHTFALINDAARYYGRRATIVENGVEREIRSMDQIGTWGSDVALDVTMFVIPAQGGRLDTVAGRAYVGHAFVPAKSRSRVITIGRDSNTFGGGEVPAGIESVEPLNIAPERIYERHNARYLEALALKHSRTGANHMFAYDNAAPKYIYDSWRLLDEQRGTMQSASVFGNFVGHSYVELTPFTALLRVSATYEKRGLWAFAGYSYVGRSHVSVGTERLNDVGEAIFKSRSMRDQIWFTTATYRPMKIDDLSFDQPQQWQGMMPIERTVL